MWAEACALLDRAEQLHRQFFAPAREAGRHARWEPPIDVFETERQLRIIVALPGVAPEAVQVQTEGGILVHRGKPAPALVRREHQDRAAGDSYGSFERRIVLQLNRLRLDQRELVNGCLVLTFVAWLSRLNP